MKARLRHTVTLLLTLCISLGSVGVALSEQLCIITGLKEVNLVAQEDDCCEKPEQPVSDEDSCCKVDVSYEKLETVSSIKHLHVEQSACFTEETRFAAFCFPFSLIKDNRYTYTDSSPPLFGRSLLTRIQILLI